MIDEGCEVEIIVADPDALRAWITATFPGAVNEIVALETERDGPYQCTMNVPDKTIGAAIKLYWHKSDA